MNKEIFSSSIISIANIWLLNNRLILAIKEIQIASFETGSFKIFLTSKLFTKQKIQLNKYSKLQMSLHLMSNFIKKKQIKPIKRQKNAKVLDKQFYHVLYPVLALICANTQEIHILDTQLSTKEDLFRFTAPAIFHCWEQKLIGSSRMIYILTKWVDCIVKQHIRSTFNLLRIIQISFSNKNMKSKKFKITTLIINN